MFKKSMILAVAVAAIFTACKKDSVTTTTTTSQKIMNKWSLVSTVDVSSFNGTTKTQPYTGIASDYIDFRTDGKAYQSDNGKLDTTTYKILSDTYIKIDTDTFQIKTLTDNSFVLNEYAVYTTGYDSYTITLKK